jgi:glycosyltransferase involved in cell wall biosynthesis
MPYFSVSAVVLINNRASLLQRALPNLTLKGEPGDEIIFVGDESADNTMAMARAFGATAGSEHRPHVGSGAAREAGVGAASGDFVGLGDTDDEWMPGRLAPQLPVLELPADMVHMLSDSGCILREGKRIHRESACRTSPNLRPLGGLLGRALGFQVGPGPLDPARRSDLNVGHCPETCLPSRCVYTGTVTVRRVATGTQPPLCRTLAGLPGRRVPRAAHRLWISRVHGLSGGGGAPTAGVSRDRNGRLQELAVFSRPPVSLCLPTYVRSRVMHLDIGARKRFFDFQSGGWV